MAEYHVERHDGASAQVEKDGSVTRTQVYLYNSGNAASRPTWGIAGIGIDKYDPHPDDSTCLAIGVTSSAVSGELGWFEIQYVYSNRPFDSGTTDSTANGGDPGQTDPTVQPNPTLRTPTVAWSSNTRMVPFTKDRSVFPKAVVNSAGQPFEGLTIEACTTVISISFALASSVNVRAKQAFYQNRVNHANFTIVPAHGNHAAGTLRCNAWNGTLQFEAGFGWYCQVTVEMEYKAEGWDMEILDVGTYEKVNLGGGSYTKRKIIDATTGRAPDGPVKLNGMGQPKLEADPDVYLTFRPYTWGNFANIFAA